MNRFVSKLLQGTARLAFWRKSAEATPEQVPASAPEQSPAPAAIDSLETIGPVTAEQAAIIEPPPADEASATTQDAAAEDAPQPRLSFLARLKNGLRRQPKPEQAEAAGDEEDAAPMGRMARVLALLSSKRVWIPGVSVTVLAVIASMAVMLQKSNHEKDQLQAKLAETQKALKQKPVEPSQAAASQPSEHQAPIDPAVPHSEAAGHSEETKHAADPVPVKIARAPVPPKPGNSGECDISSKENVSASLMDCIEAFNSLPSR